MWIRWWCLPLCLGAAGCVSDYELRAIDARGNYERTFLEGEAVALESGGRRRVVFQSSPLGHDPLTEGQLVLMYLSVPLDAAEGINVGDTRAFVVWSDVSAEFSGFLHPEPLDHKRGKEWKNLRGRYRGTLRESNTGELRNVEIDVKNAPIQPVGTAASLDRAGYAEAIRAHLYRLEFDPADREYWRAGEVPAAGSAAPAEGAKPSEHD